MKRAFLTGLSALLALFLISGSLTAFAGTDRGYTGMNTYSYNGLDLDYLAKEVEKFDELGMGMVRMGINDEIGSNTSVGDEFDFTVRDKFVDTYLENGIEIHAVISHMHYINRGGSMEEWLENFRYRVENIVTHYKGRIKYYILGNEPDIDPNQNPEMVVHFQKVFYETVKKIDPGAVVEACPVASPESTFLREMIRLGVADYCDIIGIHAYGGQIHDSRLGMPWKYMAEFGVEKPVAISECGVTPNWAPAGVDQKEWRRRWIADFYVQAKRFGYDHVLYYTLHDSNRPEYEWSLVHGAIGGEASDPGYLEIKNQWNLQSFQNGGFEEANADGEHGWLRVDDVDKAAPEGTVHFVTEDEANARGGSGYAKMENGKTAYDELNLRQTVDGLIPGKTYHIEAYTKVSGSGRAMLRALGYQHTNGDEETVAFTETEGEWQKLSLNFTPTNTWVVIDLTAKKSEDESAQVLWDDVTFSEGAGEESGEVEVTEGEYNVVVNEDPDPDDTLTKKQAENATSYSQTRISFSDTGYTGTGYMDFQGGIGSWFEWDNVESEGGSTILSFRYADGFANTIRNCAIAVNGEIVADVPFVCTQGWNIWQTMSVRVMLKPGRNTIRVIESCEEDGVNIDKMELSRVAEDPSLFADPHPSVTLNGNLLQFEDQPAEILSDRTMVPMRKIFEALGATVAWDAENRTVTGKKSGKEVVLKVGSTTAMADGKEITLDVPAQIVNDRTLVPLRFIAESLEAKVDWDGDTRSVFIVTDFTPAAAKESVADGIQLNAHEFSEAVGDVLAETTLGGGGQVRYFDPGEELKFEVELPKSGKYRIRYNICTEFPGAQAELYAGGELLNRYIFEDVKGWLNYATYDAGVSVLPGGKQTISVKCTRSSFDMAWVMLAPVPEDTEVTPIPKDEFVIPGEEDPAGTVRFEAENHLPSTDIDVLTKETAGRKVVAYFGPGEALSFEPIEIPADGKYKIQVCAAAQADNARAAIYIDGIRLDTVKIQNAGIYEYVINESYEVQMQKGTAEVKLACENMDFDIDWFRFVPV